MVEAVSGYEAQSLSLIMDSVHNLSDEMAMIFLVLAYVLSQRISQNLVRTANLFNSVGLVAVSGLLLWYAVDRFLNPTPVSGSRCDRGRTVRGRRQLRRRAAAAQAEPEQRRHPPRLHP